MTDELWLDQKDVIADSEGKAEKANIGKKRKNAEEQAEAAPAAKKSKKATKEEKPKPEGNDDKLDQQISDRKTRLRSAKAKAAKAAV